VAATRAFVPPESRPYIVSAALAAIGVQYGFGWVWSLPVWAALAALVFLFRNPRRPVPAVPLAVVSPVDGVVVAVQAAPDPYLQREAVRVRVRPGLLGVYFARSPIEGRVMQVWSVSGMNGDGSEAVAASRPRSIVLWLRSDEGDDVTIILTPRRGAATRCYVQAGERLGQGQRCGYIPFALQAELMLPPNARVRVEVGDRVAAGSDILATLVHK
jgi:phosphatidylserine decarboxylase